jgi:hypothetical protein
MIAEKAFMEKIALSPFADKIKKRKGYDTDAELVDASEIPAASSASEGRTAATRTAKKFKASELVKGSTCPKCNTGRVNTKIVQKGATSKEFFVCSSYNGAAEDGCRLFVWVRNVTLNTTPE